MGVILSERDARRLQKCLHAFERGGFGGKAEKRRHFNYDEAIYWYGYGSTTTIDSYDPFAPTVLNFSTEVKDPIGIGALSSNVLTLSGTRTMQCRLCCVINGGTSASVGIHTLIQLEYNRGGGGYGQIDELFLEWELNTGTTGSHAIVLEKTIPFDLQNGDLLRVTGYKQSSGDADATANCYVTLLSLP